MDFDDSLFEGEKVRNVDSSTTLYKAKVYFREVNADLWLIGYATIKNIYEMLT